MAGVSKKSNFCELVLKMIYFDKTVMKFIAQDALRLSCKFRIEYLHSDDEPIAFGTPAYWDTAISECCSSTHRVLGIYWKFLPQEKCNRITDYKQVWGLLELPKGLMETRLDFGGERLYVGMAHLPKQLAECDAQVCLLIPEDRMNDLDKIWNQLLLALVDFTPENMLTVLQQVVHSFPQVIALLYQCAEEAALTVVCNHSEVIWDYFKNKLPPESNVPHLRRFANPHD